MIHRIETGWLQVNDALSRQGGRKPRKQRARPAANGRLQHDVAVRGEDGGAGKGEDEPHSLDIVA